MRKGTNMTSTRALVIPQSESARKTETSHDVIIFYYYVEYLLSNTCKHCIALYARILETVSRIVKKWEAVYQA